MRIFEDSYLRFSFRKCGIKRIKQETPSVKSFYLEYSGEDPTPGQFFMIWVPGFEEIPISVSGFDKNTLRVTIAAVGKTTKHMMMLRRGDIVMLRGPFGRGFSIDDSKKIMIVGGGYGAAPLIYTMKVFGKRDREWIYLVGAKKAEELLFLKEAKKLGARVEVATEDGSAGYRGLITELFEKMVEDIEPDCVLTCGPEPMMRRILEIAIKKDIPVQASLERYMKCGFGICGSCVLDPLGLRVCTDGPVFKGEDLIKTDFGKFTRDICGRRVSI